MNASMLEDNETTPLLRDASPSHRRGYLSIGFVAIAASLAAVTVHVRKSHPNSSLESAPALNDIHSEIERSFKSGGLRDVDPVQSKVRFCTQLRCVQSFPTSYLITVNFAFFAAPAHCSLYGG